MERKNAWKAYSDEQITELEEVNKSYREFLTVGKTERECVKEIIKQAEATGYQSLQSFMEQGRALQKGDKVYAVCMNKSVAMFQIGEQPLEQGMNILGAHIDSPRLDVKQNPLYEDSDMAYLDTHYYGGIKKYQWVTLPLAIHGVVVKKNGETVDICIGEKEDDPVFCVTDLLIHLAGTQMEKKALKLSRERIRSFDRKYAFERRRKRCRQSKCAEIAARSVWHGRRRFYLCRIRDRTGRCGKRTRCRQKHDHVLRTR